MEKRHGKIFNLFFSLAITFALVNTCSSGAFAAGSEKDPFAAGKQIINQFYIDEVPASKIDQAEDLKSLVESLGDPYSAYFTDKEYDDFKNSINNTFSGVGMQIDKNDAGIVVLSVFDETPAKSAGIEAGDIILTVDGHDLATASAEEAVSYIKGDEGTTARLEIKRSGSIFNLNVERKKITLPTVEGHILDGHIGYIKISSFGEKTGEEFNNVLSKLKASATDSYIVDIRNNSGGYMDVVFDIAGHFIGEETVLVTRNKAGKSTVYTATDQNGVIDKPVVFLINKYSASGSEILAAAVKDNKKAYLIGETTYGKGVAQSLYRLPDGGYLKLTTLRFMSPLGNEINKAGVKPDMAVPDDPENGSSPLDEARKLLNGSKESQKMLPATGSPVDLTVVIFIGLALALSGICLVASGKKKDNI
ncbi:MAG: S41 family peptidase [Clostridiaceae bacterium]